MSELFKNKYRVDSARAKWWNYSSDAAYFITICTKNFHRYFGYVNDSTMHLSEIGIIAHETLENISVQFPWIILDEFIIMPDHMHAILIINHSALAQPQFIASPRVSANANNDGIKPEGGITKSNNPMLHENLGRAVRWYKGRVTFEAKREDSSFSWHSSFYDRIIRSDEEFSRIAKYIRENPEKWKK